MQSIFKSKAIIRSTLVGSVAGIAWRQWQNRFWRLESIRARSKKLIVVSGCDSGLGLAMSYWAANSGYKVLAGCYNLTSDGSQFLRNKFSEEDIKVAELDVTRGESLTEFRDVCSDLLEKSKDSKLQLWAVIPNAAQASFGEFFWMPETLCRRMMDVNFWGSVNLVKIFQPLLLSHKSRLLVISSDCADYALPGLSIYSATKAALECWSSALRLEVAKYGINVLTFQPGNFPTQSRLFASQSQAYEEMRKSLTDEDLIYFGNYFDNFNQQLIHFSALASPLQLKDDEGLKKIFLYLLEKDIRFHPIERRDPPELRYIHFLLRYLPVRITDWIKHRLMNYPAWTPTEYPTPKNTKLSSKL